MRSTLKLYQKLKERYFLLGIDSNSDQLKHPKCNVIILYDNFCERLTLKLYQNLISKNSIFCQGLSIIDSNLDKLKNSKCNKFFATILVSLSHVINFKTKPTLHIKNDISFWLTRIWTRLKIQNVTPSDQFYSILSVLGWIQL